MTDQATLVQSARRGIRGAAKLLQKTYPGYILDNHDAITDIHHKNVAWRLAQELRIIDQVDENTRLGFYIGDELPADRVLYYEHQSHLDVDREKGFACEVVMDSTEKILREVERTATGPQSANSSVWVQTKCQDYRGLDYEICCEVMKPWTEAYDIRDKNRPKPWFNGAL